MTDLAATDVTITEYPLLNNLIPQGNRRVNIVNIAFGDGALTYKSGGVPMPAKAYFGMFDQIDMMVLEQPPASGYEHHYDRTNNTVRIYNGGTELTASSDAPAATTLRALVIGS